MNFKSTYILIGVVALTLAALGIYVLLDSGEKNRGEGHVLEGLNAAGYKPSDINSLEIERTRPEAQKLVFVRQPSGQWKLTQPVEARVNSAAVEAVVREVLSARPETKGVDLTPNLAVHGLDHPTVKITLRRGADRSGTLSLGNVTVGGDRGVVYVLSSDNPKEPQAIRLSTLDALFKRGADVSKEDTAAMVRWLDDFRPTRLLGEGVRDPLSETQSVRLQQGKEVLALSRKPEGAWKFDAPAGYGDAEEVSAGAAPPGGAVNSVRQLLDNVYNIQVASPSDYIEDVSDLAKYGLDPKDPKTLRITVERRELQGGGGPAGTDTLLIGKEVEDKGDKVYAMLEGDSAVAKVNAAPVRAIRAVLEKPSALRNKTLVTLPPGKIDAVDVEVGGEKFSLRHVGEPPAWKVYDAAGNAQPASRQAVENLLKTLTQQRDVADFPAAGTSDETMGLNNKSAEVRIWAEGIVEDKDAKPDAAPKVKEKPDVRLVFGKQDVNLRYVRRVLADGAKMDALVQEAFFGAVTKRRLDFVDASPKPFPVNQVVKLSFNRGKEPFVIEKDPPDDKPPQQAKWKIVSPESRKGRQADPTRVAQMLGSLAGVRPVKVVADKAGKERLAGLGLDPDSPKLKAVVTLREDKEGKERTFFFGNEDPSDKNNVYARAGDRDVVFEVPKSTVNLLSEGEVMDMVVYAVPSDKLKGLRLRGWSDKSVSGEVQTLDLTNDNGVWVAKGQAFKVNQAQVSILLTSILSPRADQFVAFKGKPDPKYGLDVKKGALEITLEVEGKKEPVTLTVSATGPDPAHLYAETNQLPGDVFTLPKAYFQAVMQEPASMRMK